jgi:predicted  nucleic acid-binding Zn-ribbon protein
MKVREQALRSKRFEAEEKKRKVEALDAMIRDFQQMALDLERQIESEEARTGIRDQGHFSYSTFAKAAAQRRENLMASIADLEGKRDRAVIERDDAVADIERAQADARDLSERTSLRSHGFGAGAR